MQIDELKEIVRRHNPDIDILPIGLEELVFEERVRLKCLHCPNYGVKWTCPGRLPQLNYRRIISEYEHAAVVVQKTRVESGEWRDESEAQLFRQSANTLHRAMLDLEKELFSRNNPMAEAFIGCNCQLCENGCPAESCAHPSEARLPWDAIGCNVVKTLERVGIKVVFPPQEYLYQYGLIVW